MLVDPSLTNLEIQLRDTSGGDQYLLHGCYWCGCYYDHGDEYMDLGAYDATA